MPGTPRIVPIDTTGLDGASRIAVRGRERLGHSGCGPGPLDPDLHERLRVGRRAVAHPPLLEVDGLLLSALRVVDDDVRLDPLVAHRQQPDPRAASAPASAAVTSDSG